MASRLETILAALQGILQASLSAEVRRNEPPMGVKIPRGGLVILRDGEPDDPETTMSPLTYHYEHVAELEILVQRTIGRDAAFDALRLEIDGLICANRTAGGADWIEMQQGQSLDLQTEGASPIKAMSLPLILHFTTSTPIS